MRSKYFVRLNNTMWSGLIPAMLIFASGWLYAGCGGTNTRHASDKDLRETGTAVELAGAISVRGSTPATIVILETDDDEICTMQASPITDELARLSGVRVRVQGIIRSPGKDSPMLLEPSDYDILSLESGEMPTVGWIAKAGDNLLLKDKEGIKWLITGDLISILSGFDGAKLWVVGKKQELEESKHEISVTGYGVLSKE
ncbi:MAG: hypothetical protein ABIA59_10175 [Candidatus Latescibacterota bacterium]